MVKLDFRNLERIDKRKARNLYLQGIEILAAPCKANLNSPWHHGFPLAPGERPSVEDFESLVNSIAYYSCNYELGYYLAYYKEV